MQAKNSQEVIVEKLRTALKISGPHSGKSVKGRSDDFQEAYKTGQTEDG